MYYFNRFNRKDYKNSGRHFFSKKNIFPPAFRIFFQPAALPSPTLIAKLLFATKGRHIRRKFFKIAKKKLIFPINKLTFFFQTDIFFITLIATFLKRKLISIFSKIIFAGIAQW